MKKILSVLMAALMLFTCVGSVSAANENYVHQNNLSHFDSLEKITNETVYGSTVDFLYNTTTALDWGRIYLPVPGQTLPMTSADFALIKGNVNTYLKRFMTENYLGDRLFTERNATALTNFIGNLLYPGYENKVIKFPSSVALNEDDFFTLVVKESGLDLIIQTNWCGSGIDFLSFMTLLGVVRANVLDRDLVDGEALGVYLLKGIYRRMVEQIGPVNYLFDLYTSLKGSYNSLNSTYAQAINALFALKLNVTGGERIEDLTDLMNMIFNGMNANDASSYQFAPMPITRMQMATDATENFYYIVSYFAINYKFGNNESLVKDYLSSKLPSYLSSVDTRFGNEEQITNAAAIKRLMTAFLTGNLDVDTYHWACDLSKENIDSVGNDIWSLIKNSLAGFFRRIAEWFDNWLKVLTGEGQFGKA